MCVYIYIYIYKRKLVEYNWKYLCRENKFNKLNDSKLPSTFYFSSSVKEKQYRTHFLHQ